MQYYSFDRQRVGVAIVEDSQTIPDDSYTIKDLIQRSITGCMPNIGRNVIYDDDPDIDNPDPTCDPAFDIVDRFELAREAEEVISSAFSSKEDVPPETSKELEEQKESEE